ncbi:MAG TPA: BMP family ABC transporter substrate-binding protein [Gaiellaceae bacterium]|nr:BMP family ABC transporter substrate-binding protein [Gaiellaceae bacterium]
MNGIWKPVVVALVAAALALAGCGGDDEGAGTTATGGAETAAAGSDVKVGLVTDVGQLNDRGFNQLAFEGVKQAEAELGVEYRVIESASDSDYVPNMESLVDEGYDLIIGVGFAQGDAVATVAKEYPDTKFAIIDVDQSSLPDAPENVVGLLFQEEQVGYLAGVLAAKVAQDEGASTISSVGGMKEPPVDRFIAGYQAGAKATVPEITVLNGYSQDWDDVAKCKEVALDQIARGSRIVFQVAGGCGLGALDAAKEEGVHGIGVDADQSFLGPHVLTSAMKRVDAAVFLTIKDVVDGTWEGGRNATYGLEQDGVALGETSDAVGDDAMQAVEDAREKITTGEIDDIPTTVS